MGFDWTNPPTVAWPALADAQAAALKRAVYTLALSYAPEIETWMKQNAPWQDRTGNARQTLWAEVLDLTELIILAFGHGVEYGTFLELAHGGSFSILGPALDHWAPRLWKDIQALVN